MANMVSWKDYEGIAGFGSASAQDVADLNKALEAGQEINPPGSASAGDGFALRVESLEATLKLLTYRMEHIKLWKDIQKIPAYNTVEEYNELKSYGSNKDVGWMAEGDLPEASDSTYERKFTVIKYIGTTRAVTHVMSLVRPAHGDVVALETQNGTMDMLQTMERGLFYGDSSLSSVQFDGYDKLMRTNADAANIIDLRGKPLSEDILTDACLQAYDAPNYGMVNACYLNPKVKADFVKTFFPKERHNTFNDKNGMVGNDVKGFTSVAGDVAFREDVFIDDGGSPTAAVGDPTKIPGAPTVSTAPTTPADGASKFEAVDAGDYFYKVQACNRYGRSAAIDLVAGPTAVAVVAGDKVTFGLTPSSATTEWFEIFRTKVGGASGTERLVLRVPNAAGAGATVVNDFNDNLPGTTKAFLFQMDSQSMSFAQLAPMIKIPLATIDTSIRWAQVLYGAPKLYAPNKNVIVTNIGRPAGVVA